MLASEIENVSSSSNLKNVVTGRHIFKISKIFVTVCKVVAKKDTLQALQVASPEEVRFNAVNNRMKYTNNIIETVTSL